MVLTTFASGLNLGVRSRLEGAAEVKLRRLIKKKLDRARKVLEVRMTFEVVGV